MPARTAIPSRRVSWEAMRPRNSAVTRSTEPSPRPCGEAAELFAERHEGRQRLHRLGAHGGDVDGVGDDAAGQRRGHLLGGDDAGAVLGLGGRGAEVGRDDDVVAGEDRVLGEGLGGEDVERGAAELAGLEAGHQRVEVDQLAAGAVDEAGAVLHRGDRLGVDQADRLRRLRHVQGDQVGAAEHLLDALQPLDPELAEALGGDELVEGDDVHLEALGALGDELADAAEADHAERLAVELGALELGPVPAPGDERFVTPAGRCGRGPGRGRRVCWGAKPITRVFAVELGPLNLARSQRAVDERAVGLRDVAEEGERQRQGVLGGGDRVRLGRVGDDDAAAGGGRDVDVVDAGAGAADHLQVGRQLDQLRRHLRRRADQDRVVLADLLAQLLVGHLEAEVDVEVLRAAGRRRCRRSSP